MKPVLAALAVAGLLSAQVPGVFAADPGLVNTDSAIDYVLTTQAMHTDGSGNFHGDGPVTRLDVVNVVLHQVYSQEYYAQCYNKIASNLRTGFTLLFRDVSASASFGPHLCAAMVAGLVTGGPGGSFRPSASVTTAEAAKILSRAYGVYRIGSTEPIGAPWYQTYMWVLRKRGAILRVADDAGHTLTRYELAQMLYALRDQPIALHENPQAAAALVAKVNVRAPVTPTLIPRAPAAPAASFSLGGHTFTREPTIRGVPLSVFMAQK